MRGNWLAMRSWRRALVALAAVVVLGGCGGDEEAEPTATSEPVTTPTVASAALPAPPAGPGTPIPNDGDVASGCWQEGQRTSDGRQPLQWTAPPAPVIDPARQYTATLQTSQGAITVQLLPSLSPRTVNNFVCLARAGYYADVPFHRIIQGFVIQGGDPTGSGSGGPGYEFADEPVTVPYEAGMLAMANAGPDTNGSQFFIILGGGAAQLQPLYNLFGRVVGGQEVVDAIAAVPVGPSQRGEPSVPRQPVTLQQVTIAAH